MKTLINIIFVVFIFILPVQAQILNFERDWATYFGDENIQMGDSAIDSEGNIYFVGMVQATSMNLPTTSGSYQRLFGGGTLDGFLVKMDVEGQLVWATYYGGEGADLISGIAIDDDDKIYLIGYTSSATGIATTDSHQPNLVGATNPFVAKFSNNGAREWATYYPGFSVIGNEPNAGTVIDVAGSDIVVDGKDFFYFMSRTNDPNAATAGTFQTEIGQDSNNLLSKFNTDGERIWATYYGINNGFIYSIALGQEGLYVGGKTLDCPPYGTYNTYFATPGSHQPEPGSCATVFISKFSLAGNRLWSTYYGNNSVSQYYKNALIVDGDAVYFSGAISSPTNITTPGSYQEDSDSQGFNPFLVKLNGLGERQWGTFVGLPPQNTTINIPPTTMITKDTLGNVYMMGLTRFASNISTPGAFQEAISGEYDAFLTIFNPAGELLYGTYYGGMDNEYGYQPLVYNGGFYIFGKSASTEGITTSGSYQSNYIRSSNTNLETNIFIGKFSPAPLAIQDYAVSELKVFPNPSHGSFSITSSYGTIVSVEVYSVLGQLIKKPWSPVNNGVMINHLERGLYMVKVHLESGGMKIVKVLVN